MQRESILLGVWKSRGNQKRTKNLLVSSAQMLANCLQNSCCLRVRWRRDKVICGSITSRGHTHGRIEYITPAILEVSKVGTESQFGNPRRPILSITKWANWLHDPLCAEVHSSGDGTKILAFHMWEHNQQWVNNPCRLRGPKVGNMST